jgi:hypothetical protein
MTVSWRQCSSGQRRLGLPQLLQAARHDLFRPIESKTCTTGGLEALLFAYRAACYEACSKRAQRAVAPLFANIDDGKPVEEQEQWQHVARTYMINALDGFHYHWTCFDGLLPAVCCGTFLADNDLTGPGCNASATVLAPTSRWHSTLPRSKENQCWSSAGPE